jgi:Zn-dependent protease
MSRQDFDFAHPKRYYFSHVDALQRFLFVAPVLLFSVIAHEIAHGYAALKQGDPTAYQLGRLSWNPAKHIDPFLTVLLPLMLWVIPMMFGREGVILGGAKPVPVNPRNYRNYKRGDIIVSLAGVATNLIIALGCAAMIALLGLLARVMPVTEPTIAILQAMMMFGVLINLVLILFNLMPIPPLDGSHVMKYLLPPAWSLKYQEISRYGILILIALLYFGGGILSTWMKPAFLGTGFLFNLVEPQLLPKAWELFRG